MESSTGNNRCSEETVGRVRNRDTESSFSSEYDLVDREYVNDDLSTDALKLQMYEEIVQRFGPDEQFSEMLRSQGTLDRMMPNNEIFSTNTTSPITRNESVESSKFEPKEKVEVLLMSQIPETHRSSFHSLIISPNNSTDL